MKSIRLKNNSGFSLNEVLVSVGIIIFLNAVVFLSRDTVNTGRSVEISAHRLASEIRKMQSYTLNLQDFKDTGYPSGGWGLYFKKAENDEYRSFADMSEPNNHKADSGEANQTIVLPNGIIIKEMVFDNGSVLSEPDSLYLAFDPPDPTTWICSDASCDGVNARIVLSDNKGNHEESVLINKFGLIDVLH